MSASPLFPLPALAGALALSAALALPAAASELPSEDFLAQQGLTLVGPLPAVGGLKAWAAYRDRQPVPIYRMPDGKHWVLGTVIDAQGRDVNAQALQAAVQKPMGEQLWGDVQRAQSIPDGRADAPRTVYVFTDPNCPHCRKLHPVLQQLVEKRNDVVFYIKIYSINKKSYDKAKAIACSKSSAMLDEAMAGKEVAVPEGCEATQLEANLALGRSIGVRSTPTLVFPDGRVVPGGKSAEQILQILGASASPVASGAGGPE